MLIFSIVINFRFKVYFEFERVVYVEEMVWRDGFLDYFVEVIFDIILFVEMCGVIFIRKVLVKK